MPQRVAVVVKFIEVSAIIQRNIHCGTRPYITYFHPVIRNTGRAELVKINADHWWYLCIRDIHNDRLTNHANWIIYIIISCCDQVIHNSDMWAFSF